MTAAVRSIADINRLLDAESVRRARVRFLAETIPADVDLDDAPDVIRALYAAGVSVRSYLDVLDDGIEAAKEARG